MKIVMRTLLAVAALAIGAVNGGAGDMAIRNGSQVAFDYTLTVDGKVVDSSEGRGPLNYTQGDGRLIQGLTKQMEGLKEGDERIIEVTPEEGYGKSNPDAIKEYPVSALPAGIKPQVGMVLEAVGEDGRSYPARVIEVKKDSIIMDLNHPMAGKTLTFKVKVVSVR